MLSFCSLVGIETRMSGLLPPELLWGIVLPEDMKTILCLCRVCKHFSLLAFDNSFWKGKVKQDYGIKTIPPRFQENCRDLFVYLMTKQKIPVKLPQLNGGLTRNKMCPYIEANYRTPVAVILNETRTRGYIQIPGKLEIFTAIGQKYPYRLIEQEDWEQAYLEGIEEIGKHMWMFPQLETLGTFIIKYGEQKYMFPYGKKTTLHGALDNVVCYAPREAKSICLRLPELCIYMKYTPKATGSANVMDWNVSFLGDKKATGSPSVMDWNVSFLGDEKATIGDLDWIEKATMGEIMRTLGWKKNTQGFYPILHGEVIS